MLSATAADGDASLWVIVFLCSIVLQGVVAMGLVAVHKRAQYLLEQQRQKFAERILQQIQPGVSLESNDQQSWLRVHGGPVVTASEQHEEPPPRGELPANVIQFRHPSAP